MELCSLVVMLNSRVAAVGKKLDCASTPQTQRGLRREVFLKVLRDA